MRVGRTLLALVAGCATSGPATVPDRDASTTHDASVAAPTPAGGQSGVCRADVTLAWSEVKGASYGVEWGLANQTATSIDVPVGTTSVSLTNLRPGNYAWHVRASSNGAWSDWSSRALFSIAPGTPGSFDAGAADFHANVSVGAQATESGVILDGPNTGAGTDGVFAAMSNTTLPGGEHDFTAFTIGAGVTVTVTGGALLLSVTGVVDIQGTLDASGARGGDGVVSTSFGKGGAGAAGGDDGGDGVLVGNPSPGNDGSGLGKGGKGTGWQGGSGAGFLFTGGPSAASKFGAGIAGGASYGTIDLVPLYAGSGGGGGSGGGTCGSGGGGGGGGALKLTAGKSLTVGAGGIVRANGGAGGGDGGGGCGGGGGGSGGAIWLVSRSITNDGTITALGGAAGPSTITAGGAGSPGRVRMDGVATGNGTVAPAVGYTSTFEYAPAGSTTSPLIAPANLCGWGTVDFDYATVPGTSVQIDVLDANGKVLIANVAPATSLASLDALAIKLRANLETNDVNVTPTLRHWTVTYTSQ